MDAPTTAYTEVQIDEDSISLTLISESGSSGPVIEDTERFTFEELQDMAGEHLTLRLSTDSREALVDSRESAVVGNLLQSESMEEKAEIIPDNPSSTELMAYMGLLGGEATDGEPTGEDPDGTTDTGLLPTAGEVLTDMNAPDWSDDDWVEVVEVLPNTSADEYVIQENHIGRDETVADVNPSYDRDEPVIIGQYEGTGKHYAFPASRLA